MKKIVLAKFELNNVSIKKLAIFLDQKGQIVLLPTLWSLFTNLNGLTFSSSTIGGMHP